MTAFDPQPVGGLAQVLGPWLRERRSQAMLTQEQLAERAELSVRTVRNLESGRIASPHPASVRRLVAALGAEEETVAELFSHAAEAPGG